MPDDNNLNELQRLMQEIAKSTKSMADDMQKQSSRQEKLLLNKAAKDDAKKTEEFHREQQQKLQGINESEEEQKDVQEEILNTQIESLNQQKKTEQSQVNASKYLKQLAEITQENKNELKNIRSESSNLSGILAKSTRGLMKVERVVGNFAESDSTLGGFKTISGMTGALSGITALTKIGKEGITGFGSRTRQKDIEKQRRLINKEQTILSAQMSELEEAKRLGDEKRIKLAESEISSKRKSIKSRASNLSEATSKEFLHQQQKQSGIRFKGSEQGVILAQAQRNIEKSILKASGILSNGNKSTIRGNRTNLNVSNDLNDNTKSILNQNLSVVSGPSTYGQFVAGTYDELRKLNTKIDEGKFGGATADTSPTTSGNILGALGALGGLTAMLKSFPKSIKGLFTSGKSLIKGIGGVGKKLFEFSKNTGSMIANFSTKVFSKLGDVSSNIISKVKSVGSVVMDKSKDIATKGINLVKKGATQAVEFGKTTLGKAKTGITSLFSGAVKGAGKAGKTASKVGGKALGKSVLKKIPVIGALAGLGFGAQRLFEGDVTGAGLEVLSGGASLIPGIGTGASIGIDAALAARDMNMGEEGLVSTDSINLPSAINNSSANVDKPLVKQSTFTPSSTLDTAGAGATSKIAEYQILAKMIAKENLKMQQTDAFKKVLLAQASYNADATKGVL